MRFAELRRSARARSAGCPAGVRPGWMSGIMSVRHSVQNMSGNVCLTFRSLAHTKSSTDGNAPLCAAMAEFGTPTRQPAVPYSPLVEQKPRTTTLECWCVCTIEDCRLIPNEERATANVFQKWHVVVPNFKVQVSKGTVELRKSGADQGVMSPTEALEQLEAADGRMMHGVLLHNPSSEIFPVNPQRVFSNMSSRETDVLRLKESLCWVQYNEAHQVLSVQLNFSVHVEAPADFAAFPFDRHMVPFQLNLRSFKNASAEKFSWVLPSEIPAWAKHVARFSEDKRHLTEIIRRREVDFARLEPVVLLDEDSGLTNKPILCIRLQRRPEKFILSVAMPIAMIVILALCTFFAASGFGDSTLQFSATLTSALTVTAFRTTVVTEDLPLNLTYLTYADVYIMFIFFYHMLMAIRAVYRSGLDHDHDQVEDLASVLHALRTDIALALLWVLPHALIIGSACQRGSVLRRCFGFDKVLRRDWSEVKESMVAGLGRRSLACETDSLPKAPQKEW